MGARRRRHPQLRGARHPRPFVHVRDRDGQPRCRARPPPRARCVGDVADGDGVPHPPQRHRPVGAGSTPASGDELRVHRRRRALPHPAGRRRAPRSAERAAPRRAGAGAHPRVRERAPAPPCHRRCGVLRRAVPGPHRLSAVARTAAGAPRRCACHRGPGPGAPETAVRGTRHRARRRRHSRRGDRGRVCSSAGRTRGCTAVPHGRLGRITPVGRYLLGSDHCRRGCGDSGTPVDHAPCGQRCRPAGRCAPRLDDARRHSDDRRARRELSARVAGGGRMRRPRGARPPCCRPGGVRAAAARHRGRLRDARAAHLPARRRAGQRAAGRRGSGRADGARVLPRGRLPRITGATPMGHSLRGCGRRPRPAHGRRRAGNGQWR